MNLVTETENPNGNSKHGSTLVQYKLSTKDTAKCLIHPTKMEVEAQVTGEIQDLAHRRTATIKRDVTTAIDEIPDRDRHQMIADLRGDKGIVGDVENHMIQTLASTKR